jgi:hypothetical protein
MDVKSVVEVTLDLVPLIKLSVKEQKENNILNTMSSSIPQIKSSKKLKT